MRMLALILALGLLGAPAAAEELLVGLTSQTGWNDNVFFSTEDVESGVPYRLSPWIDLDRRQGDLTYNLNLRLSYEDFVDVSDADTIDTLARLRGGYRFSDTTRLSFREEFARTQSLSRRLEGLDPGSEDDLAPDIELERQRLLRNSVFLGLEHSLSRRWQVNANFADTLFDPQDDDLVDSNSASATTNLSYLLSPRTRVGLGFGATRQDFSDTPVRDGGTTNFYRLFASWSHLFTPTLSVALQAGPTWIDSDVGGTRGSESRLTYFGNASLSKSWETLDGALSYNRTESTSSGVSGGSVLDSVTGSLSWAPSHRWTYTLIGSWARRTAATEQLGIFFTSPTEITLREITTDDAVDTTRIEVKVQRSLSKRLSVFGLATWLHQERNFSSAARDLNSEQEQIAVLFGIIWKTEPRHL